MKIKTPQQKLGTREDSAKEKIATSAYIKKDEGWRGNSVAKSYSTRGPELSSQHPYGSFTTVYNSRPR